MATWLMALLILDLAAKALSMPIIPTKSSQKMGTGQLLMFKFITYVTLTITDPVSNGLYEKYFTTITVYTNSVSYMYTRIQKYLFQRMRYHR